MLYVNHNHYNLIYPKRDNEKNKKIYNNPKSLDKLKTSGISKRDFKISRPNNEYVKVNYPSSENIYNEIYNYLFSIEIYKDSINEKKQKYPNMNINQIYSYFPLTYPDRIIGDTIDVTKKRKKFRDLIDNFKLNEQNRLIIKKPLKRKYK